MANKFSQTESMVKVLSRFFKKVSRKIAVFGSGAEQNSLVSLSVEVPEKVIPERTMARNMVNPINMMNMVKIDIASKLE